MSRTCARSCVRQTNRTIGESSPCTAWATSSWRVPMPSRLGLAWKLALAFFAVFAVTLAAVLFALDRATTDSFRSYLSHTQMMRGMMNGVQSMMGPSEEAFLARLDRDSL